MVESERIRNLVRFDARHSRDPWVCGQLAILEAYSSQLIADGSTSVVDFLDVAMGAVEVLPSDAKETGGGRARHGLGDHLARAHERGLRNQSVATPAGLVARENVHRALKDLGLITVTYVPLSAVLC